MDPEPGSERLYAPPPRTSSVPQGRGVFYHRQPLSEVHLPVKEEEQRWWKQAGSSNSSISEVERPPPPPPSISLSLPGGSNREKISADFSDSEHCFLSTEPPSSRSRSRSRTRSRKSSKTPSSRSTSYASSSRSATYTSTSRSTSRPRTQSDNMARSTHGDRDDRSETQSMYDERRAANNRDVDDLLDSRSIRSQRTATRSQNGKGRRRSYSEDDSGEETEREDDRRRRNRSRSPGGARNGRGFIGSLLFPTSEPSSPQTNGGRTRSRRGSASSSNANGRRGGARNGRNGERSDDDESGDLLGGLRYGDDTGDDVRSLKMGGSRPPSALGGRLNHKQRTLSVASSIASPAIGDGPGPGYLYLHDVAEVGKRANIVNPSQVNLERERTARKLGSASSKGHKKSQSEAYSDISSAPAVPRMPESYSVTQHIKYATAIWLLPWPMLMTFLLTGTWASRSTLRRQSRRGTSSAVSSAWSFSTNSTEPGV